MLDLALNHQEQLIKKLRDTWLDEKYKYYHASNFRDDIAIAESTWVNHQFVSIKENEVIGMVDYRIDRASEFVYGLGIINFEEKPSSTFSLDLRTALKDIFEKYGFRRIEWSVIIGNPIEKSYDRICSRYEGRIIGTYKNRTRLIDGKFYDEKFYEIERTDYITSIKTRRLRVKLTRQRPQLETPVQFREAQSIKGVDQVAKGKYKEWLEPEGLLKLEGWARNGLTDEQIAQNIGINPATLYEWKKKYPKISESLKKGKEIVDLQVENALLKRALGYSYNEDKYIAEPMSDAEYYEKLDEYMNKYKYAHPEATDAELMIAKEQFPKTKMILVERKEKEVIPDTTAQIFWLKNRRPGEWREKQEIEMSQPIDDSIKEMQKYFERQKKTDS